MYEAMLLSRRLDERAWVLHRQGKIAFHISGMGHEAIHIGTAFAMRRGYDILHPYYRDLGLCLALGMTPREFMLGLLGRKGDPNSGARQMPSHWGVKRLNIITGSSPVATQVPQAAGIALAEKLKGGDRVTIVSLGEGSTSEGDFHEALNWAGVHKLPLVVLVENNIYAISVPIHLQMNLENVADRACAYGIEGVSVDGNDIHAVYREMKKAIERARSGGGTTLFEAKTYRLVPHSSDDDDRTYRSREEVEEHKKTEPLVRLRSELMERGILTEERNQQLEEKIAAIVDDAQAFAEAAPMPAPEDALGKVYAD
jgi:2-oxoisovalerate dehydrogenase E1 component alpha subunit